MITDGSIDSNFRWLNEPSFAVASGTLTVTTAGDTDFWQRTHYGFRRDNGHCLVTRVSGDFSLSVRTEYEPSAQYDQCGLIVRLDAEKLVAVSAQAAGRPLEEKERDDLRRASSRIQDMLGVAASGLARIGGTVELLGRYGRAGFKRDLVQIDAWEAARTVAGVVLPATGRAVEIAFDFSGDGALECVPEELNQVLTNLVQNAIEAAPDGAGHVRVAGSVDGERLVLSVRDNGPGIPPDVQARLFTPFFTTKGPGRGPSGWMSCTRVTASAGLPITARRPLRQMWLSWRLNRSAWPKRCRSLRIGRSAAPSMSPAKRRR